MKTLCNDDKDWLLGIIGDPDDTKEVVQWIEHEKFRFEEVSK